MALEVTTTASCACSALVQSLSTVNDNVEHNKVLKVGGHCLSSTEAST